MAKFDRTEALRLRALVENCLKSIMNNQGYGVDLGGGTFTDNEFRVRVSITQREASQPAEESSVRGNAYYSEHFRLNCHRWGLNVRHLGATIQKDGETWTVIGAVPRARRSQIVVRNGAGALKRVEPHQVLGSEHQTEDQIMAQFVNLACSLSPENLTCDGELPRSRVAQRRRDLMNRWASLERQLGRTVTESQAYAWSNAHPER